MKNYISPRRYCERPDGTIEYLDREWVVEQLCEKYYMEAAGNNFENEDQAMDLTDKHEIWLQKMNDEQLVAEYDANIGSLKFE